MNWNPPGAAYLLDWVLKVSFSHSCYFNLKGLNMMINWTLDFPLKMQARTFFEEG
jgi:hypothetical protein